MLTADSAWELRQTLYELDEHLAKYPHSPEARLLKDQMVVAMERAKRYERPLSRAATPRISWLVCVIIVAILGFLIYLALAKLS
jgi:hypothetical protein